MPRINLINPRDSRHLKVQMGTRKCFIPVEKTDKGHEVPDWAVSILDQSSHRYEIVGAAADEAGEGAGGTHGDTPAELPDGVKNVPVPDDHRLPDEISDERREELLAMLDRNLQDLEAGLPGLSAGELGLLYAAEEKGKNRKGALAVIKEAADKL